MARKLSPDEVAKLGLEEDEAPAAPRKLSPEEVADLGLEEEDALEPDPVQDAPPAPARPRTSALDAAERGGAQGASLFLGDEVAGVLDAGAKSFQRGVNAIKDAAESGNPLDALKNPVTEIKQGLNDYRETRDRERTLNRKAADDQPGAYGAAQFATALPAAIATAPISAAAPLAVGAGYGLAGSEAELTPDKATGESVKDAAKAAATGAVLNKVGVKLGGVNQNSIAPIIKQAYPVATTVATKGAPLVLPAAGAGIAAFGDELGVSDADRVSAGLGAAASIPGLVSNVLEGQAGKFGNKATVAKTQIADKVREKDAKVDAKGEKAFARQQKEAIKGVRSEEDAAFKTQQEAAKKTAFEEWRAKELSGVDKASAEALSQKSTLAGQKAVKEYEARSKSANQRYKEQIGTWDDEIKALQTVRARRQMETNKREKALADLAAERSSLDKSVQGHTGASWKELYTRLDQYERITGEPLPAKYLPLKQKAADMYRNTSEGVIVDPEVSAKNYRALKEFELDAKEATAKKDLEAFKAQPFDEDQAVRDMLKKKGSRVSKNEAYALAKKLGLNPGDFETFEVLPPKGGFGLVDPAPRVPTPLPSAVDKRLDRLSTKRTELESAAPPEPRPDPARRPEEDILASSGLSKYTPAPRESVDKRVGDIVERAVPNARDEVTNEALKWAGGGAGVGIAGMVAGRPELAFAAPPIGAALGARHAVKTMTAVDAMTGKLKDPVAAAGVYTALERVFAKVPSLAKKYGTGFREGLRPIQLAFYIKNDPELAKALDEDAAQAP